MDSLRTYAICSSGSPLKLFIRTILCACIGMAPAFADLPEETPGTDTLRKANGSWIWIADGVGNFTQSRLFDTTNGKMLGMLSTGYWSGGLAIPSHGRELYTLETHFSRSTRGQRTDVIAIYDPHTLLPTGEIEIPNRRMTALKVKGLAALTTDDRFLIVQNFTPAQSVSIVDLENRTFVAELNTPGCASVAAGSERFFSMVCGDGGLLWVQMDDNGHIVDKGMTQPFFDPLTDPVATDVVRSDKSLLYASNEGYIYPVDTESGIPEPRQRWSFLSDEERDEGWRFGGFNHTAVHTQSNRLFILMQDGGEDSYEEPATEVWVFDYLSGQRLARYELDNMAMGIAVSRDANPRLYTSAVIFPIPRWAVILLALTGNEGHLMEIARFGLDVFSADDGSRQRTIENTSTAPTLLQVW